MTGSAIGSAVDSIDIWAADHTIRTQWIVGWHNLKNGKETLQAMLKSWQACPDSRACCYTVSHLHDTHHITTWIDDKVTS